MVEKTKLKKNEGKKQVTVSQMQKTNKILVEKLNSKHENAHEVVKTDDDIVVSVLSTLTCRILHSCLLFH